MVTVKILFVFHSRSLFPNCANGGNYSLRRWTPVFSTGPPVVWHSPVLLWSPRMPGERHLVVDLGEVERW